MLALHSERGWPTDKWARSATGINLIGFGKAPWVFQSQHKAEEDASLSCGGGCFVTQPREDFFLLSLQDHSLQDHTDSSGASLRASAKWPDGES